MTEKTKEQKQFAEFLATTPPCLLASVVDIWGTGVLNEFHKWIYPLQRPDIQLHCETCEGARYFRNAGEQVWVPDDSAVNVFLSYICRNCGKTLKTYAIRVKRASGSAGDAIKFGELPAFGPHVPARVITLIGPDRELFLQGRRAENQGMGIGAFSYYRRVVENQKGRIIREIGEVAQKLGAKAAVLEAFKKSETETQFSKAIDAIKDGIPDVLKIGGYNPLTLLHKALSEGLHEHTDAECTEIAQEIRLVVTELAERISQALKEEAELKQAVTRLLSRKTAVPTPKDSTLI